MFDLVCRHLDLVEKDYFGLRFVDPSLATKNSLATLNLISQQQAHQHTLSAENWRWLDAAKPIRKQLKCPSSAATPYVFHFRVKFYVSEPSRLVEEYTRYHFFLQLKRDIVSGKLSLPAASAAVLASYAVQSELGDFAADEHANGYLSKVRLIPGQTKEFEAQVSNLHRLHVGQTPADAEYNFLEQARRLETYGLELHAARDQSGNDIEIGVSDQGLFVFQGGKKLNCFSWAKIVKISFKRRYFFIQLRRDATDQFDTMLGFNLVNYRACKQLWKYCVEQHTFFRRQSPQSYTKRFFFFFKLRSKFRYR